MGLESNILETVSTHILDKHKGSYPSSRSREVAACFVCLAAGARPGFLYDQGRLSDQKALQMAKNLAVSVESLCDIMVVKFSQDIIFVKLESIIKHLQDQKLTFIDVGKGNPTFVNTTCHTTLLEIFQEWRMEVSCLQSAVLNLDDKSFESGPSVIGLLIGFPVIYYLLNETSGHCLSHTRLLLTKCLVTWADTHFCVCSFSVPTECLNVQIEHKLAVWRKQFEDSLSPFNLQCNVTQDIETFDHLAL